MKKFKIGVIRVLTIDDEFEMSLHGRLLADYFPFFVTESFCIEDQYQGIYDQKTLARAVPKIVSLAEDIADNKDGIIISCAGDPAVDLLKSKLNIPVTGAGRPTATYSLNFGVNIGVLGIEKEAPANYKQILGERMVAYSQPESVKNTNDLQTPEGRQTLVESAHYLKDKGAETIALACTGMSTVKSAPFLESKLNLPVIDPVLAEGLYMYGRCLAVNT